MDKLRKLDAGVDVSQTMTRKESSDSKVQTTKEKYEQFAGSIQNPTYIRDLIEGRTVSSCPRVKILTFDDELQCLLDSRSEVSLVTQSYFEKGILPKLGSTDKAQMGAHNYFTLSAANDGIIPISAYVELDIEFEGFLIKDVGFLVTKDPSTHLGRKRKLKTPGVIGCNLLKLACLQVVQKYGIGVFDQDVKPAGISQTLWGSLIMYHHAVMKQPVNANDDSEQVGARSSQTFIKSKKKSPLNDEGLLGKVKVGQNYQPICIPGNSSLTVNGIGTKLPYKATCLVQQAENSNLPPGIVVNSCYVKPTKNNVPVILINTNSYNVWIRQPLLVAELYDVELCPWDHEIELE